MTFSEEEKRRRSKQRKMTYWIILISALIQPEPKPPEPEPTEEDSAPSTPEEFHAHLDKCHQCATQPFGLCATGRSLMHNLNFGTEDEKDGDKV